MKNNPVFILSKCVLTLFLTLSLTVTAVPHSHARVTSAALMEEVQMIKGDLQTIAVNGLKRVSVTDPDVADIADATKKKFFF